MTNPFESGPGDRPLNIHGDDRSGPASDHAVLFDAANGTGSPAANAFLAAIRKHIAQRERDVVEIVEDLLNKSNRRIAALERAVKVEAERNADPLEQVSREFLDEGGDDDEMKRLDDMAARHRKDMEARHANQS
ncbi:MAG: hypothetical protein ABJH07_00660 [Sedimentitalea sp.]|uniref:hypothetical protein n=1 Tax=Sedimentitalea sp. TaxID=2048915 RepID=UPI003266B158